MEIMMFVVHDEEGTLYDVPFFARNETFAKRRFYMDCVTDAETMTSTFKDEMHLYFLGTFNQTTGELKLKKEKIMSGKNIMRKERDNEVGNGA